jgi:MFS family permease
MQSQIFQTMANGEGNRGLSYIYGGRAISGFGIGAISAVAPTYVSECSPKQVRGRITGMAQIMVAIGVMISYFINCMFKVVQQHDFGQGLICAPQLGLVYMFKIAQQFGEFHSRFNWCPLEFWHLGC